MAAAAKRRDLCVCRTRDVKGEVENHQWATKQQREFCTTIYFSLEINNEWYSKGTNMKKKGW